MDTVAVIIQEASNAWQANRNWIIPAIAIIVQIAMIIFIVKNTNRQIKNQNKESRRPHLIVDEIKENWPDKLEAEYQIENSYNKEKRNKILTCYMLEIVNIGYGVAHNIKLIGVNKTTAFRLGLKEYLPKILVMLYASKFFYFYMM